MNCIRNFFRITAFLFSLCFVASAQQSATLQTASTIVRLEAGQSAPRIINLQSPGEAAWSNAEPVTLIDHVIVNGKSQELHWYFNPAQTVATPQRVAFTFESPTPHLRLIWEWLARTSSGPLEHRIQIQNLTNQELWIPLQDSFQFHWKLSPQEKLRHFYVEKGADTPSAEGTHRLAITQAYRWTGLSSSYAHPKPGEHREIIPFSLIERASSHSGWYVGIEFSGRTRLSLTRIGDSLTGAAGLNPDPGPFRTRLAPGESFETPTIFLGAFSNGVDAASNTLRRWVKNTLANPLTWKDSHYPFLTNNSWGSGMIIDEALARRMVRDSAELGVEMFHIDAGWFRGVGDWYPDPKKFPHGLAPIADEAHQHGLKFGLWVDWTQAALGTEPGALNIRDPKVKDWLVAEPAPDWKPEEFKGQTIDIGVPAARDWAQRELERIVANYHLDMLEHDGYLVAQGCMGTDHPHAPPDAKNACIRHDMGADFVESSNATDVSYHAVRAYYDIHSQLRKTHPDLLFEVCNDGGRMVDFGSAAHADYFSITDTYDPLSNRRAFYDTSWVLPPAMLESYVERWPISRIENFRYMLRSGMMGWFTIMVDTTSWTDEQHTAAKAEINLYKTYLRPLIRNADLYHVSERPNGVDWDGMEYFDPSSKHGALYAFRGSTENEKSHNFPFRGLNPRSHYQLHFQDHSSSDQVLSGEHLMQKGFSISLPYPNSSEIVLFQETTEPISMTDIPR
jgi:melibiase-like protein/glycosyl hydrolase family 36